MKQVVTNKSGALTVLEVPAPQVRSGFVLVRTRYSLISAGTEGAQVKEGKAGLLTKARQHPDQVRQAFSKVKKEGIRSVASQVKDKLEQWRSLGYSLSGTVVEVGDGIDDLAPGDLVACAGATYAVHAEFVSVPRNLVAKVPTGIDPRHAAFATLGSIALHGVRRAQPTLGETAVVVGLGLVGQLTTQLLSASGVRVAVSDLNPDRVALAMKLGAEVAVPPTGDPSAAISGWTGGAGADMALVCAATASSDPVQFSAKLLRDRGRLVVVGDVGMELERGPFYQKELDFTVSRSYGPGRYDPAYEEGGVDYPVAYVRWTEGRNLAAFLDLIRREELRLDELITDEVPVDRAPEAFQQLVEGKVGMGALLRYDDAAVPSRTVTFAAEGKVEGKAGILLVGAGWFARTYHLPHLSAESRLHLAGVVTGTGANARQIAEKSDAGFAGTDLDEGLAQPGVDAVLICTRHNLHVPQIVAAVEAGKHVLVEKPLALDATGLAAIASALRGNPVRLAVGFNRRHAPLARKLRDLLAQRNAPVHGTYRMNAGRLPKDHWVNDPVEGGGRLLGEGCHAFDFFNYLTGSEPVTVQAMKLRSPDASIIDDDNLSATVTYANGSVLTLLYSTAGPKEYPKEHIEIIAPGIAVTLTDFRELVWAGKESGKKVLRKEDKGQAAEMHAWAEYLSGGPAEVVDFAAGAMSTWLTIQARESARQGRALDVASTLPQALGG